MIVDLTQHLNKDVQYGNSDFPISLKPIFYEDGWLCMVPVENKFAVVREDNGLALSVVSNRYTLVEHKSILQTIQSAIETLDLGEVPRGIFVDRGGARMRALFKFPNLSKFVSKAFLNDSNDELCPCIKIQNTYDGTSRVSIHIGAFRFVCTNLAVGGGGCFAGGFMAIHQGTIPVETAGKQLESYLTGFDKIVEKYREWKDRITDADEIRYTISAVAVSHRKAIMSLVKPFPTVYGAYNVATDYATHKTRTANTAFEMLAQINAGFQNRF